MAHHGHALYFIKKDNANARPICKPTHISKELRQLLGIQAKPHACVLFHAEMKENNTCYGSHYDLASHNLKRSGLFCTR